MSERQLFPNYPIYYELPLFYLALKSSLYLQVNASHLGRLVKTVNCDIEANKPNRRQGLQPSALTTGHDSSK